MGLAYYLRLRFYGTTGLDAEELETERLMNADSPAPATRSPETKTGEITRQLAANNVDYYFAWNNCASPPPPSVLAHEEITQGRIPELRIYRLAAGAAGQ